MVSASALINTILTQMQEYVKEGALRCAADPLHESGRL